ncbi:MAG: DUF883 domain-containing protein [Rhodoferax sp.]|uniref:DUF883 family protein n=1 Tax=Rhodoferax sp. TaxID=50421 RepID=UPI00261173A9|nr:DUF883 domain-containing protein [Rhodoferax sp.]MDD2880634.1 DUF883 domain-containing protein [Rhodoferax sp.]
MSDTHPVTRQVLIEDTKLLIADAQDLLQLIADKTSENVTDLRFRLEDKIAKYKKDLAKLQAASIKRVKDAGQATDDYVHHEPWKAVGIAAGVAFVAGLLICRRGRD